MRIDHEASKEKKNKAKNDVDALVSTIKNAAYDDVPDIVNDNSNTELFEAIIRILSEQTAV